VRYYVYPVPGDKVEVVWSNGLPLVKCPVEAFGDVIERLKPAKIEYHHLLKWPLDILSVPCAQRELYLHDSFLWCARYHSVMRDGAVCNAPEPKKCADCSGESKEFLEKKRAFLAETLPKLNRFIANSAYTAKYALENLSILCEVEIPAGAPLPPYPKKKRVGYFGGFGHVKGTPVLLKAWRILKKGYANPRSYCINYSMVHNEDIVIGFSKGTTIRVSGDPRDSVIAMPEFGAQLLLFCDVPAEWLTGRKIFGFDDVLVMGSYHRSDLPDLCNLVDLAVVPSINESYGMVKRELDSLGVPVVATSAGGLDGTVQAGDACALAEAIRGAL
jgi:glycosyltransferase involved in cell wall biosynthesis